MSETQPPSESSSLSSEENVQLLHLVQDCSNNLRHAKAQQWQAGYFTILAYAAIVAAAYAVTDAIYPLTGVWPNFLVAIGSLLSLIAFAIGVWMVWDSQCWMARLRRSLGVAEEHFSCRYRRIAGSIHGDKTTYHSVFYRASQTWLITVVMAVGWLIASAVIILTFGAR